MSGLNELITTFFAEIKPEQVGLWGLYLNERNISYLVRAAFGIAGAVAVIVIIIGGILYSAAAGDPGKIKRAKDTILYAVIGLVVVFVSFPVIQYVIGSV